MLHRILSVIAGAVIAAGLVFLSDVLTGKVYPPPAGIDLNNAAEVKKMVEAMPAGAFGFMIAGYAVACFAGGLVAALVSGCKTARASFIVGVVITAGSIMNVMSIPGHPLWFVILGALVCIPFALLGYMAVRKKTTVI
ncbi:MAG TPA: hypothetical protein VI112_08235 [Bacteroidia bacterium]|jgi:hypothetical protein